MLKEKKQTKKNLFLDPWLDITSFEYDVNEIVYV